MPGWHRQARGSRPASASAWFVPVRVCRERGLPSPCQSAPGSPFVGFIDRRFRPRITAGYICGKRSAYLCAIAAWRVDSFAFLSVHRARIALSQVKALLRARPGKHDPQHFPKVRTGPAPFYTSDPHGYAQQSLYHVLLPGWQAARQRAGARARRPARRTPIWPGPSPTTAGTGCSPHTLQGRRPASPGACLLSRSS
jgi:hypothetical protein